MNLRDQKRIAAPSCFACRWAGKHIVIWPQEPVDTPVQVQVPTDDFFSNLRDTPKVYTSAHEGWTSGRWKVFYNVQETIILDNGNKMKSRHTELEFCPDHWFMLENVWVYVVWDEVRLDYI